MRTGEVYSRHRMADGRVITFRSLKQGDLEMMMGFANSLVAERTTNPDIGVLIDRRVTKKSETEFLAKMLKGIRNGSVVSVAAVCDGTLAGHTAVSRRTQRDVRHTGVLGIAVHKDFRDRGVGQRMLRLVLDRAEKEGIRLVELQVFGNNARAIHLYEKAGFKRMGVLPKGIFRNGNFIDDLRMYRQA
ncbi:MAG TPA: GNAT family N-acetyltransferase [Nitrososphaerales archaeon]|nr:GNAT family N-acetyltransferase [Nitrososphaerales archaeon]